jgi:lipoprotein NlpI
LRFGARRNTQALRFNRMGASMRSVLLCSALAFIAVTLAPSQAQVLRRFDDMAPVAAPQKQQPAKPNRKRTPKTADTAPAARSTHVTLRDVAACAQVKQPDAAIAGCTRIIEDSRQKSKARAHAHYNRGNAHAAKGDHAAAIADYDETIKLAPNDARAYNNRGTARSDAGDAEQAIADFGAAIKRDKRFASAFFNRANTYAAKGETERALADYADAIRFNRRNVNAYIARGALLLAAGKTSDARVDMKLAMALDRRNAYAVLWSEIAERRGKQRGALAAGKGRGLDKKAWPAPVLQLFAGELKADAVLAAADSPDPTAKAAHTCEANFYSGEHALIAGNREEAVKLFSVAAKECPRGFLEGIAAAAELKGLGEKTAAN